MFPKHFRLNLLGLKCETLLGITLDIHFLGKALSLITGCDLSYKPGITGFNVPTNLFWNFAQIWVWNSINWVIRTLKVPFSTINKDLRWSLCISLTKLMQISFAGFTVWQLQWGNPGRLMYVMYSEFVHCI